MSQDIILLNEVIDSLNIVPDGIYIDGTFGCGGHSRIILECLNKNGKLFAIDRDYSSIKFGEVIANRDKRLIMIYGKFSKVFKYMKSYNLLGKVNGILLDLGLSRSQLENAARGFSFLVDGPLDMRMDVNCGLSASDWLRRASLEKISWVLKTFGEEKFSKKIARSVMSYRKNGGTLTRTHELVELIVNSIPWRDKNKHPATRTFQAIRIYINNELEEIKKILESALSVLMSGGRLSVISFHSLEDRIVKHFIRQHNLPISIIDKKTLNNKKYQCGENFFSFRDKNYDFNRINCYLKSITKIFPSKEEIERNICARSAILRCAEKVVI